MKIDKSFRKVWTYILQRKYILLLLFFACIPYLFYSDINSSNNAIEFYSNKIFFTTWSNIAFGSYRFFLFPVDYLIYLFSKLTSSAISVKIFYSMFIVVGVFSTYRFISYFIKNNF